MFRSLIGNQATILCLNGSKRFYSIGMKSSSPLASSWKELFQKHFLEKDYNKKAPEIKLNHGNPQRLAIIEMIEQGKKLSEIQSKFPQFETDEILMCKYVEENPGELHKLQKWKSNENVVKSACKNFRDQSPDQFIALRNLIEELIQKKSLNEKQAVSYRNEFIILQPKLILYFTSEGEILYGYKRRNIIKIEEIISRNGDVLEFISPSSIDASTLLDGVKQDGLIIRFLPASYMKDQQLIASAVMQNPKALVYCFRKDLDYSVFPFYSSAFLLNLFRKSGGTGYQYLPEHVRKRIELAHEAVKYDGRLLEFVPKTPINIFESSSETALKVHANALQFVSDEFQLQHESLIESCLSLNVVETLQFCHSKYLQKKKFILNALKELRKDDSIMSSGLTVIGNMINRMKDCKSPLLEDEDVIFQIFVTSTRIVNPDNIELVNEISNDNMFIEKAAVDYKNWFIYACSHNKISLEMMKNLLVKHGISGALPDFIINNEEWAKFAIENDVDNIKLFPPKIIRNLCSHDSEFEHKLLKLIDSDYYHIINYLSDSKRNNKEYAMEKLKTIGVFGKIS
ncbi:predicted protein [Naegleria gruberi]|uniref:Predicted protein n=1 Tax=Naegleria gruberi TaxID=5762 RepID=D2VYK9_NAEGR|nr:uncharacterized protein NAEGRDRAFT_53286 [Naegleria gruberi]EFC38132.1 predicted protein [Naegleria gruberi]|eukprot:XP_002670876.1 predicted protein [Naegleria gruberi strain NEG-M]